jgi:hypothetical protein
LEIFHPKFCIKIAFDLKERKGETNYAIQFKNDEIIIIYINIWVLLILFKFCEKIKKERERERE